MALQRIWEFDTWRPNYGGATVNVYKAGTTTPASLYLDEAGTSPATNPQILASQIENEINYGKFTATLYTADSYYLDIDGDEQTGIERPPLFSLVGVDASLAVVTATSGSQANELRAIVDRFVHALDFGELSTSAATTNTTILSAAIAEAATRGGADVLIPAGVWPFNQINLGTGVMLRGEGQGATTLRSTVAGVAVTIGGDGAGLAALTLDGQSVVSGSSGVNSEGVAHVRLEEVLVKSFAAGVRIRGGLRGRWRNLSVDGCTDGVLLEGHPDGLGSGGVSIVQGTWWSGGLISNCTSKGVQISWEGELCINNSFQNLRFEDNTGVAITVNGARFTTFRDCVLSGNTGAIDVHDDGDSSDAARLENTVIGFRFEGGEIDGGTADFTGTCENVVFENVSIKDVDFDLATEIVNAVLLRGCTEDAAVTIAGEGTKLHRFYPILGGGGVGLTADATPTKAWSIPLLPGQKVYLEAVVIGRQRNGEDDAFYHIAVSAHRDGAELDYDTQTGNFTLGDIVTGAASGASGRIVADADGGATGTLTLHDVVGTFLDNEAITDETSGAALANGALSYQDCALKGSVTELRAAQETDSNWAATFVANGPEIELRVTGAASKTIEWTVDATVRSN